jgi:hypothetical protein
MAGIGGTAVLGTSQSFGSILSHLLERTLLVATLLEVKRFSLRNVLALRSGAYCNIGIPLRLQNYD